MKLKINYVLSIGLLCFFGCAKNPYTEFYINRVIGHYNECKGKEAEIYIVGSMDKGITEMESKGYKMVGYSSFKGGLKDTKLALKHCKKIGACVVLVETKHLGTKTFNKVVPVPNDPLPASSPKK